MLNELYKPTYIGIDSNRWKWQLEYGFDENRSQMKTYNQGALTETKYYVGNYEKKVFPNGTTKEYTYISAPTGMAAVNVKESTGTETLYYIHTDYLGSIMALSNSSGQLVEKYYYDAWGNRKNPSNWTLADTRTNLIIDRGYTGHEHIDNAGLINMNGRLYDPILGRMLSPDPFTAPGTQGLNRYSYVLNNPLKYTDPSGYKPIMDPMPYWDNSWGNTMGRYNYGGGNRPDYFSAHNDRVYAASGYKKDENGNYVKKENNEILTGRAAINWIRNNYSATFEFDAAGNAGIMLESSYLAVPYYVFTGSFVNYHLLFSPNWNTSAASGQGGDLKTTFGYVNDAFGAAGISATGVELYTNANAPSRIAYTTINGTKATINSTKVLSIANTAGQYALVAGVAIDVTLSLTGNQSWGKTIVNTGVGLLPLVIGTGPGIVVGVGYLTLDKFGAFERPTNLSPYSPPPYAVQDATRVSMPLYRH